MYQGSNATTTITSTQIVTNEQQRNDDRFQEIYSTNAFHTQSPAEQSYHQLGNLEMVTNRPYAQRNDSISLALEEIGAILDGKDFADQKFDQEQYNTTQEPQQYHYNQKYIDLNNQEIVDCVSENQMSNNNNNNNILTNQNNYINNQIKDKHLGLEQLFNVIVSPDETTMLQNYNNNNNNNIKIESYTMNANFDNNNRAARGAYVEIIEQPAKCALRFRYKCEGRSAGSLLGSNSTSDNKTYPSIKIHNYVGRAVVVISCVSKEAPYRSHPHNIVGKEGCKKGICTIVIQNEEDTIRSFASLGIQCVKRKDIEESLSLRESIKVDPFRNGFGHKLSGSNIDLNVVRLCFQVFITGSTANKCDVPLTPVVSDPIHDKKAMSDLVITKLSHCSAPATGGREVILLCDRISKDDIQIRFYEEREGKIVWETQTELSPTDIHKQVAICFKTPKYHNENITQPVMARVQLRRLSDNQVSEPRMFQFLPCESDEDIISRKRQKIELFNMNHYALDNILQPTNLLQRQQQQQRHAILGASESPQQLDIEIPHHHNHHQLIQVHPHQANLNPNPSPHMQHHQQQQQQQIALACTTILSNQHDGVRPDGSRTPLQAKRSSTVDQTANEQRHRHHELQPATSGGSVTTSPHEQSPSPTTQQRQPQQNNFMIDASQNLVVRREIIDNEGRVMRLVDRPTANNSFTRSQQETGNTTTRNNNNDNNTNKPNLDSSLDRIHISELMPDMAFNQNIDLNLGLG